MCPTAAAAGNDEIFHIGVKRCRDSAVEGDVIGQARDGSAQHKCGVVSRRQCACADGRHVVNTQSAATQRGGALVVVGAHQRNLAARGVVHHGTRATDGAAEHDIQSIK